MFANTESRGMMTGSKHLPVSSIHHSTKFLEANSDGLWILNSRVKVEFSHDAPATTDGSDWTCPGA